MKSMIKVLVMMTAMVSALAVAQPKVVLDLKAEKEITVEENGKQVVRRVVADKVDSGKDVFYTLTYTNQGDSVATNVEIKNQIPENTIYVLDSAWGKGAELAFSIDQGKTFKKPSLLVYDVKDTDGKMVQKTATPEIYTHVLWVVKEIQPGKSGEVGFKVKVN